MKHCCIYKGSIIFARELRRMKRKRRNRIIIAWVLLLTLMPISIVKATHFHDGAMAATCHASASSHSQGSDDGGTCPICHFFLSPFVEAPAILLVPFAQPVYISSTVRMRMSSREKDRHPRCVRLPICLFR